MDDREDARVDDAGGMAEAWARVAAQLGIVVEAERLFPAAERLFEDPTAAWALARRALTDAGTPAPEVRRALFGLLGVVTDREPAVAERSAPALALLVGAPSLAAVTPGHLAERVHDGPLQDAIALQLRVRENPSLQTLHAELEGLVASLRAVIAEAAAPRSDGGLRTRLEATVRRCPWAPVQLEYRLRDVPLPEETEDLALRVVQEALANLRHAKAESAHVVVAQLGGELRVLVEDDGTGFDPDRDAVARPGHLGLVWLQGCVAAAGGRLRLVSAPGHGARIVADLPLTTRQTVKDGLQASLSA